MKLTLLLVHYRTPDLAVEAVRALRADLGAEGSEAAEWLLVDNGNDAEGAARLRELPVTVLDPGRNLGFAGGVNYGVARSETEIVVVLNPDVLVRGGCLAALRRRLEAGAYCAGPRFYWDRGGRLLLPPPEPRRRRAELVARLATRGELFSKAARSRWRRHAWRHWLSSDPLPSYHLSGAMLAFRRSAFEEVGPFDEGYRLYFEETDWLLRLERRGLRAEYVPTAEAIHLYARSTVREPAAETWFEASRERFQKRHYGAWFPALWRRSGVDPSMTNGSAATLPDLSRPLPLPDGGPFWVEISPSPLGFPAAGEWVAEDHWTLPSEILARLTPATYFLQIVDRLGRERRRYRVDHGAEDRGHEDG